MKRATEKEIKVMFANAKLHKAYEKLKRSKYPDERELYGKISDVADELKKHPFCGIEIPKKLIPKIYVQEYGVDNLWKYDLPGGWRVIYTVTTEGELYILAVIMEWFTDHKEYERRFRY
jgi:Txe/YoeB family toxin of Txe-Axe toxin-antitoxin module